MRTIECVFLDLGNVLYGLDSQGVLNRFAERSGENPVQLSEALHDLPLMRLYDSGSISSEDFYQQASRFLCCDIGYDEFEDIWNSLLIPKKRMFRLARHIHKQVDLLILSNTNEMHAKLLDPDVRALTDMVIYSFQVGCLKPDREIYEKALSLSGSSPERTLFIDDRIENLRGAASLGIQTHQFRDRRTLRRVFRSHGLYMPLFFP